MRVNLGTVDVSDEDRRALRRHDGKTGLATRAEVREFMRDLATWQFCEIMANVREWGDR